MKTLFYLPFAVFLLLSPFCNAQSITDEGNQWNMANHSMFGTYSYLLRIEGEMVVDGIEYKKIEWASDELGTDWTPYQYIREEGQKVYKYYNGIGEFLIYDFSLEEGDTIDWISSSGCDFVVTLIDSVLLASGEKRKRLSIENPMIPGNLVWIEGIGSSSGPAAETDLVLCATDYGHSLLCYYHNDLLLYPENPLTCFIVPTREPLLSTIRIFPNPASSEIVVEGDDHINMLRLYHSDGRLVLSQKLDATQTRMSISHLPKGIYSLVLVLETGSVLTRKIVLQH